jgi:ERCC4-type nuclease
MRGPRPTIIVDTREREPWAFDPTLAAVERRALPAGDYSIAGLETRVAVERKSLDDLVSTVIRDRARFGRELRRFDTYDAACIVVEASLADLAAGRFRGAASPASVLGAVIAIIVDTGVPVFFCSDRQLACRFAQDYLLRFHRTLGGT